MPVPFPGRRVMDTDAEPPHKWEPGCYGLRGGIWYGCAPNGLLATLANHEITIHSDGTITAHPSIKVSDGQGREWHGYLVQGVWTAC